MLPSGEAADADEAGGDDDAEKEEDRAELPVPELLPITALRFKRLAMGAMTAAMPRMGQIVSTTKLNTRNGETNKRKSTTRRS